MGPFGAYIQTRDLSLAAVPRLRHRRVIRVAPENTFSLLLTISELLANGRHTITAMRLRRLKYTRAEILKTDNAVLV